jgi:arylformamidase
MAAGIARGCRVRFVPIPGTSHYDIVFGLAEPESSLAQTVIETMGLA